MTSVRLIEFMKTPHIREALNFRDVARKTETPYYLLIQSFVETKSGRPLPEKYAPAIEKYLEDHPLVGTLFIEFRNQN